MEQCLLIFQMPDFANHLLVHFFVTGFIVPLSLSFSLPVQNFPFLSSSGHGITSVGVMLGLTEGEVDGTAEGEVDGPAEGKVVGSSEGELDGPSVSHPLPKVTDSE